MTARSGLFTAPASGVGTSPTDGRLALAGILGARGRCISGGAITTSASAMTVTVGQSVWSIVDPTNTAAVFVSPTDVATVTPAVGPASGARIDTIYVLQHNPENSDPDARAVVGIVAGTAASSPTAPAVPTGALAIATIRVGTGVSNSAACTLTALSAATTQAPIPIVAPSLAALQATAGAASQLGFVGNDEYMWTGSTWAVRSVQSTWPPTLGGGGGAAVGAGGDVVGSCLQEKGHAALSGRIAFGSTGPTFGTGTPVLQGLPVNLIQSTATGTGRYKVNASGAVIPMVLEPIGPSSFNILVETSSNAVSASTLTAAQSDVFTFEIQGFVF